MTEYHRPRILDKYTVVVDMAAGNFPSQTPHRKKLTSAALRTMWQSNPTPEVRDLLWEIYRLQDIARQAHGVLNCPDVGYR